MRGASQLESLYWQETSAALRALVALAVVPMAAVAAALTMTGAAVRTDAARAPSAASAVCDSCQFRSSPGEHAVAGCTQGERHGRAPLRRHGESWQISVRGGEGLRDPKALAEAGVPAAEATRLAQDLGATEANLPAAQRAKSSTFDSLVSIDASGQHPAH